MFENISNNCPRFQQMLKIIHDQQDLPACQKIQNLLFGGTSILKKLKSSDITQRGNDTIGIVVRRKLDKKYTVVKSSQFSSANFNAQRGFAHATRCYNRH